MPSDSKKKEMQRKKDARNKKVNPGKSDSKAENGTSNGVEKKELTEEEMLCAKLEEEARVNMEARSCTGTLATHPRSRDIKIENFSINFFGAELIQDAMLELNCGRRVRHDFFHP
jgi:ATP-binding cassette, subfamily F, member 2